MIDSLGRGDVNCLNSKVVVGSVTSCERVKLKQQPPEVGESGGGVKSRITIFLLLPTLS